MKFQVRNLLYGSLFLAIGLVLPQAFHAFGMGGAIFLPMHIPVLMAGLFVCPISGFYVGLLTPVLSYFLTGMPPMSPPILPLMVVELSVYGLTAGILRKRLQMNIWVSLIGAMILGRVALGLAAAFAAPLFNFKPNPVAYVWGAIVTGLPGIIVQLIAIPTLVLGLERGLSYARLQKGLKPGK